MASFRRHLAVLGIAALPLIAGCGSNSGGPNPMPTPPAGPIPLTRLYVSNTLAFGSVQILAPPFSAASTPAVAFKDGVSNDVDDVAFDATGRLYVSDFAEDQVDVFAQPLTNTSTATFSVGTGFGPEGIDLDASGNLYVANRLAPNVTIYNAPLSGTSTAATTIKTGLARPVGLKIHAGSLYVADNLNGVVAIYNPPFSNASAPTTTIPIPSVWGIAFDPAGNLWTCGGIPGSCNEFVPPFSNSSTPAITIKTGLLGPLYPAFDSSGNLYVSDQAAPLQFFMAPLSNASAPAFKIAASRPNGIRFGP